MRILYSWSVHYGGSRTIPRPSPNTKDIITKYRFHNLLLEGYDGSIGFINHYKLKPGEAQWLRVAFRDRIEPCIEECDGSTGSVSSNEFGETEWCLVAIRWNRAHLLVGFM
jgi:hypothetical protein